MSVRERLCYLRAYLGQIYRGVPHVARIPSFAPPVGGVACVRGDPGKIVTIVTIGTKFIDDTGEIYMKLLTYPEAYQSICGDRPEHEVADWRLRAARECAVRCEALREEGWRVRDWRPGPKAPFSRRTVYGWELVNSRLLDHIYRLVHPEKGTIWVAEPYGIWGADLARLTEEMAKGWDIRIDPKRAIHLPGSTVAIWITRNGKATALGKGTALGEGTVAAAALAVGS